MKKHGTYQQINEMSGYEFMQRIQGESAAEKYLVQLHWNGEPTCPHCGGKERNKHSSKKPNAGRGPVSKATVVGARTQRGGKVKARHVKRTDSHELQGFICGTTLPGEIVYTNDHRCYSGMVDFQHDSVRHSVGEYVSGMAHTNGSESFWPLMKRGHYGMHHSMFAKHLHRRIDEFSIRHNMHKQGTLAKIEQTIAGGARTELHWRELAQ